MCCAAVETVFSRLNKCHPHMKAYLKKAIPDRLHYRNNVRVQPIILIADEGWTIVQQGNKLPRCTCSRFLSPFTLIPDSNRGKVLTCLEKKHININALQHLYITKCKVTPLASFSSLLPKWVIMAMTTPFPACTLSWQRRGPASVRVIG